MQIYKSTYLLNGMKNIISILLILAGFNSLCTAQDSKASLNQIIKPGKSSHIKTLIKVSGGNLIVTGQSKELAEVNLSYFKNDWNPTVSFTENEKEGKLTITALSNHKEQHIDEENVCQIALNNKLTYSLGVAMGVGISEFNLQGLSIDKALFRLGVGAFTINLANTSVPTLKIDAGIGEATVNLSGKWKNDLKAKINAGIGQITIIVPKDMGVKLIVSGFLGSVETPGYQKKNRVYSNPNLGKTKHTLELDINGSIGTVIIKEQ
jgi:hypothetical protein